MKKLITVLAGGVLLAGTATLVLWFQLRAEREQGATLASRSAAPEMLEMAEVMVPGLPPPAAGTSTNVPGTAPIATAASSPPQRPVAGDALPSPKTAAPAAASATDPVTGMMKAMMQEMYPDLAAELGLTPAQAEHFLDVFATQQGESSTQFMGLMAGSSLDAGQRRQLQQQMLDKERADQEELRRMLGSKYPRWEEYQSTAEARQQVNELRTGLAAIGKPLTEPQSKALVIAFAADASRLREEDQLWVTTSAARNSPNLMRERMEREIEGQRRLVDLAAPHLDAAQLEHFRRKNEQAMAMVSSMLGMMGDEK